MITKPIRFKQITATPDHIIGLTEEGEVFYRDKPSHSSTVTTVYHGGYATPKKEDDDKKIWKRCLMVYKVELPRGGPEREAQSADGEKPDEPVDVVVDLPARKIYKDADTVKSVQTALKEKNFYKENYKIDGDLGHLTQTAIKDFQRAHQLTETGEIDLMLWNALGLNKGSIENDTVVEATIELSDNDLVEDTDEVFTGA